MTFMSMTTILKATNLERSTQIHTRPSAISGIKLPHPPTLLQLPNQNPLLVSQVALAQPIFTKEVRVRMDVVELVQELFAALTVDLPEVLPATVAADTVIPANVVFRVMVELNPFFPFD